MSEPLTKTNLAIEMGAYPTANPQWDGNLMRKGTDQQLVSACLQFDWNATYSGNIHETLTRADLWEQVHVRINGTPEGQDRQVMLEYMTEQLAADATGVLDKARQFYPRLACRAAAEALVQAGRGYDAITMIAAEVPHDTPWSTKNTVGITDAHGVFSWRPVTFGMEWNLGVGYIILCEAMRRILGGPTVSAAGPKDDEPVLCPAHPLEEDEPVSCPANGLEDDEPVYRSCGGKAWASYDDDDPQGCLAAGFVRVQ